MSGASQETPTTYQRWNAPLMVSKVFTSNTILGGNSVITEAIIDAAET